MARTVIVDLALGEDVIAFFESFADAVKSAGESIQQIVKHIINLPGIVGELVVSNSETCTAGANEIRVRFKPTDCFNKLLAAVRAGDTDFLIVEHSRLRELLGIG